MSDSRSHYEAVQRLWDCDRPVHDGATAADLAKVAETVFARLRPVGTRLLDVACGTGEMMQYYGAQGLTCYGFDFAAAKVRAAEQKHPGRVWNQSFLEPYRHAPFDYVVSVTALQYCRPSELADALRHSAEALVVGGQCVHAGIPVMELFEGANGIYYNAAGSAEMDLQRARFETAARDGAVITADGTFFHSCAAARKAVEDLGHIFRIHDRSRYRVDFEIIRAH